MTQIDEVIRQKKNMVRENLFFYDVCQILFNNFTRDQNFIKTKLKGSKIQKSGILLYFLYEIPMYRPFYKNMVNPPQPHPT